MSDVRLGQFPNTYLSAEQQRRLEYEIKLRKFHSKLPTMPTSVWNKYINELDELWIVMSDDVQFSLTVLYGCEIAPHLNLEAKLTDE